MDLASTILQVQGFTDLTFDAVELRSLALEEALICRNAGDTLGSGEWLLAAMRHSDAEDAVSIVARALSLWGCVHEPKTVPTSVRDIVGNITDYLPEHLTIAIVALAVRLERAKIPFPVGLIDLAFKLAESLTTLFDVKNARPAELLKACTIRYESLHRDLATAVDSFLRSQCLGAKTGSVELLRAAHAFRRCLLAGERPILSELDMLLGPSFRGFCESCERKQPENAAKLSPDLLKEAERLQSPSAGRANSMLWQSFVLPVAKHVVSLIEEENRQSQEETAVSLALVSTVIKVDLSRPNREATFSCRLANRGKGRAGKIRVEPILMGLPVEIGLISPRKEFEMAGESEQLVTFAMLLFAERDELEIRLVWHSENVRGQVRSNEDTLRIEPQITQPDWKQLLEDPPYAINPIRNKEKLFGRDEILQRLALHAGGGTSTFLWGPKRVGKTSVLQVFANEMRKNPRFVVIILRMGELAPLHEGQIGFTIATRLCADLGNDAPTVPLEDSFGASLAPLVPFVDRLVQSAPDKKFVVIVDEFDDLDSALYNGQRGRAFVKALRSLSEIGLTFFFVGSERMDTIYVKHATDLNKWINVNLDIIQSREDCKRLVVEPVRGSIEYQSNCVDEILDYCRGNPFYMHLLCAEVFARCANEQRTYVSESDLLHILGSRVRSLGETNFSHFWNDDPELDEQEKARKSAENCLVLACIAYLGGGFESTDELAAAQEQLGLELALQLSPRDLSRIVDRLRARKILASTMSGTKIEISLPIFKEWLAENAELRLLSRWREHRAARTSRTEDNTVPLPVMIAEAAFPISEEDLLTVSQRLFYCGKQKDVVELRIWLRQFDDDNRIEIAYLLLKRLAERGFVDEGQRRHLLSILTGALHSERNKVGAGKWTIMRGRNDNLCISFLDSEAELKSGVVTARELAKSVRPGKAGSSQVIAPWMKTHLKEDSLVVFVDDFSGTGQTVAQSLRRFLDHHPEKKVLEQFLEEGRILVYLLSAFSEALEKLRNNYPHIKFLAAYEFDEQVRALDSEAQIFDSESEFRFAKEMLFQLGSELTPQHPFGFKNCGGLVCFHNTVPNNTLPIFWSDGMVNEKPWRPLFPRA